MSPSPSPATAKPTPFLRPRWQDSPDGWTIGIYEATTEQYSENEFPWSCGPLIGTPKQGIDETLASTQALRPRGKHAVPSTANCESRDEAIAPDMSLAAQQVYQGAPAPAVPRPREDIIEFFDGHELMGPGVTDISLWPVKAPGPGIPLTFYGGVALQR